MYIRPRAFITSALPYSFEIACPEQSKSCLNAFRRVKDNWTQPTGGSLTNQLAKNQIVVNIDIEGYDFIHSDSSSRAGGLGLYIKDFLTFTLKEELDLNMNLVENIWIQIETSDNTKSIIIGVVYRHPVYVAEQLKSFSKAMEELFSKLSSNNKKFYIMGDFNIDLLKAHTNFFRKNYADNLISYSIKCTSNKPHAVLLT